MINRSIVLLCLVLLGGCTSQRMYGNHVYLVNDCRQTITATAIKYSNIDDAYDRYTDHRQVPANQEIEILLYRSYGSDLQKIISEEYQLTIEGQNGDTTLDKSALIQRLQNTKKTEKHGNSYWRLPVSDMCATLFD
jgi:hypothetical protein